MKNLFRIIYLLVWLMTIDTIAKAIIVHAKPFRFMDIAGMAYGWREIQDGKFSLFESIGYTDKIQARVDSDGFLLTFRYSTTFDIHTMKKFNYKPGGQIFAKILNPLERKWLSRHLFELDSYPNQDNYFSKSPEGKKVSIIYTLKTRNLEIMVKLE